MEAVIGAGAGALVSSFYDAMDRGQYQAFEAPAHYISEDRPRPAPDFYQPMIPTPPRRITRRPSWDLPLGDYVARCCGDIIGVDGSPGIGSHQATEQVFALQQRAIHALERPDEEGFVDDRDIRREAAGLRAKYKNDVAAARYKAKQEAMANCRSAQRD